MNLPCGWKRGMTRISAAGAALILAVAAFHFSPRLVHSEEAEPATLSLSVPAAKVVAARAKPALLTEKPTGHQIPLKSDDVIRYGADQAHMSLFVDNQYPSAKQCAECHPTHFREWSVSPHAYAQLSPVFNCMQNAIKILTNGTNNDFCIRCHTTVGMQLGEKTDMSQLDRHPTAREGITCITCHRVNLEYGKGSGRRVIVSGDITQPVYGPLGSKVLQQVLADPDQYGVLETAETGNRSRKIHGDVQQFFSMASPSFCGTCHDVFGPNGFRLEDAFSEYKASPAAKEDGVSCQDCHMGKVAGEARGYVVEPIAHIGNAWTTPRRRTNHMMPGPDYSILHPGLFPHNVEAIREEGAEETAPGAGLATMRQWLQFDHEAAWGTDQFEATIPEGYQFPDAWREPTRRTEARRILNDQFELLAEYRQFAADTLRAGYKMSKITEPSCDRSGLHFKVKVWNGTRGHGTPTGFDAERLVWLYITVWDSTGKVIHQSGDLDPNGDVRDTHSFYVHNGKVPHDHQLFSLQSKFITRNIRGGEREQILPITFSLDPLPFLRPETSALNVQGRPFAARKHKQNIEVGGSRWAKYHVPTKVLTGNGPYNVRVQMKAGMVPVNLVHRISFAGFDYGLNPKEVARRIVDGHHVLYEENFVFDVHSRSLSP